MIKKCVACNKEYETNYRQSKFCCKDCKFTPCVVCGKKVENIQQRKNKTCSLACKNIHQSKMFLGANNPNYNKKWDEDKKKKQSLLIKSKVDDEYRQKAGSANRGKKFSKERIEKMHGHRNKESYWMYGKKHTEEAKRIIGEKSRSKYTNEYKQKFRRIMEENGNWTPLEEKTDYEIYFKECEWIHRMFDIIDGAWLLVEKYGIFNNKSNPKGMVRDHIVGRKYGFKKGIFPEIMRHPANCQIISNSENLSKGQRGKGRPDAGMDIETLFRKIMQYNGDWVEQEKCIEKIKDYNNGKRWKRKEVKCVSECK